MKSDWYASQACTRYTIAHVNREWCFIKKFTGSQLHYIVQNQIMSVTVYSQLSYPWRAYQFPMLTMKVTSALPLHLFSVVSHSPIYLSYFGHKVQTLQTLQTPFIATQLPTSLSSRCNKLPPFSGSYIYLAFPV